MHLPRRGLLLGAAGAVLAGAAPRRRAAPGPPYPALAAGLDGRTVLPGDAEYGEARQSFQPRFDGAAPGAVVYPAHERDVAECLGFARRYGVPVTARGGGHSYAGRSTGPGLVLDLGALAAIDTGTGTARVGAGVRLGELHARLAASGAVLPAGSCPSVGIAGLALGGGLGMASRAHGTTSDRLTGARVVTADGIVREVGAEDDAELFWALRGGGGGNFGVVTEFRFRTAPTPAADCAFAELHWSWRDTAAVLRGWQRWLAELPDPYWSQVEFTVSGPGAPGAPAVRVVCLDGRREAEGALSRLTDLVGTDPRDRWVTSRGYADTVRLLAGCADRAPRECRLPGDLPGRDPGGLLTRSDHAARSDFWRPGGLGPDAVEAVLRAVSGYAGTVPAGGTGVVQFDGVCGGAVNRPAPGDTAFAHRDSGFLGQYLVHWTQEAGPAERAAHRAWLDGLWRDLRPWASGTAYQNYLDPELSDWARSYYGANLPRLVAVRRRYDPEGLFSSPQSIAAASPGAGRSGSA
ncbi:FAD-binding oxidoreductase [Streptomyces sp. NPDC097619]|uniref:FAD-binding oxidoreductase n=1 Tax=Streptomyces sp. NPDC097619 TaxID=3157228 RepID=UPI00332E8E42